MTKKSQMLIAAIALIAIAWSNAPRASAAETIVVHAGQTIDTVTPFLSGVCIEDVNHEIYGGLYSQMIFGESFQEPADLPPIVGFETLGGDWKVQDNVVTIDGTDGQKLIANEPKIDDGTVSTDIRFADRQGDNAGLIVRASNAAVGADAFTGYEISVDAGKQIVRLARHEDNYTLLRDAPCQVPVGEWFTLNVALDGSKVDVLVNDKHVLAFDDGDHALKPGNVGLRAWQKSASFRNLHIKTATVEQAIPIRQEGTTRKVSRMWKPSTHGSAQATYSLTTTNPFKGRQSQTMTFTSGEGEVRLSNRSLNGWGMHVEQGKPYEGYAWLRGKAGTHLAVALESKDGSRTYVQQDLTVVGDDWQRIDFNLTPTQTDDAAQLTLKLMQPGTITIGHVFLQPGAWDRYKDLPVRKDVVDALLAQGVNVLRYGGSMANHPEYRWKNMTGPRDRRPMTAGHWYPYSTNGWAIPDFLNLCAAMGIDGVPNLNVNETPADMVDFVEYANGSADTKGGQGRIADGHPAPYRVQRIELGNEERVDEAYADKFIALADAIWKIDPKLVLIVGDFAYHDPITDPNHLTGTSSGVTNMAGHRKILAFAKDRGGEVWFDVHTWSEKPLVADDLAALPSYTDAIDHLADGAKHRVVVFELNANTHDLARGLANAVSVNRMRRDGRHPIVTSANGLQPDGQNDNGWNQGLVFLNPSSVWFQPAAYVTQMQARSRQPILLRADAPHDKDLDVTASRSADGEKLVVEVVNFGDETTLDVTFDGFAPAKPTAHLIQLAGPLDATNTAEAPARVAPLESEPKFESVNGARHLTIPAHSFSVYRFE